MLWGGLVAVLVAVNLAGFGAMRADKRRARAGARRIPEATLIGLACAGGWFGVKAGQRRYRHKTRKQPFRAVLDLVPLVWVLGLAALVAT